jgi:UPF0271 protein
MRIDLNSDVGESYGAWAMGADDALVPLVTSVNIACGAHAGDPVVMDRTVRLAHGHGVAIGAHPGYPDRDGFGRRDLAMTPDELEASVLFQVSALAGFVRDAGAALTHVKPHGAMYNRAAVDPAVAEAVARGVRRFSREVVLVALAGSTGLALAAAQGLATAGEAFADRAYEPDGTLRSRRLPDSVLTDPAAAAAQAVAIARDGRIAASDGSAIHVRADTLCIHGDTPGAAAIAAAVRVALTDAGIDVRPLRDSE